MGTVRPVRPTSCNTYAFLTMHTPMRDKFFGIISTWPVSPANFLGIEFHVLPLMISRSVPNDRGGFKRPIHGIEDGLLIDKTSRPWDLHMTPKVEEEVCG